MSEKNNLFSARIIFMGTSVFADKILASLLESGLNIVSVFTKSDKKSGRDHKIKESSVKTTAKEKNIPIFQPEKLSLEIAEEIKKQKPDLIIVAAYGKIIPRNIFSIPRFGTLNIHPSLLPKFRGPSPIQNTLLCGETKTGTTLMLIDEGMDTGDIIKQSKTNILPKETYLELSDRLAKLSTNLLLETLPLWIDGQIKPERQQDSQATLCQLIERSDGKIIWSDDAVSIFNRFRALFPWPGIFTFWENEGNYKRIKLNKIDFINHELKEKHNLGEVFEFEKKIGVQTASGIIILKEVQLEGKENMKIEVFLNGYQKFLGSILK